AGHSGAQQGRASGIQQGIDKSSAIPSAARTMKIELWIEIDVGGDQHFDDIHARNRRIRAATPDSSVWPRGRSALPCPGPTVLARPAGTRPSIDGDVEGCASPPIPKLRVCSAIQQELGDLIVVVV